MVKYVCPRDIRYIYTSTHRRNIGLPYDFNHDIEDTEIKGIVFNISPLCYANEDDEDYEI